MTVESMRELLAKEYGITSEADLDKAIRQMKQINIAAMVSIPEKRKKGRVKSVGVDKRIAGCSKKSGRSSWS